MVLLEEIKRLDEHGKELLGEFLTEVSGLVPWKCSQCKASLCTMICVTDCTGDGDSAS